MKDVVVEEAEKKHQEQAEVKVKLTPLEHKTTFKRVYISFLVHGLPNTEIDGYFNRVRRTS